jgi:putative DNA primase/helicase
MTLDALLSKLRKPRREANGWMALCPAHADKIPSLSIRQAEGKILLHCQAGCTPASVLAALAMEARDLFEEESGGRQSVAEYDYRDEKGRLLFQVVRYEPKGFRPAWLLGLARSDTAICRAGRASFGCASRS